MNMDKLYKLFYSESQRMDDCCPEVMVDGKWKKYTEWTEGSDMECNTNWLDATVVYEGFEIPKSRYSRCGYCMDCSLLEE